MAGGGGGGAQPALSGHENEEEGREAREQLRETERNLKGKGKRRRGGRES